MEMPSHELHEWIDREVLGEEHPDVHDFLDSTVKTSGPHHRDDGIHSLQAAITFASLSNDREKLDSAMLHLAADDFFTPQMEEMWRMMNWLEEHE